MGELKGKKSDYYTDMQWEIVDEYQGCSYCLDIQRDNKSCCGECHFETCLELQGIDSKLVQHVQCILKSELQGFKKLNNLIKE